MVVDGEAETPPREPRSHVEQPCERHPENALQPLDHHNNYGGLQRKMWHVGIRCSEAGAELLGDAHHPPAASIIADALASPLEQTHSGSDPLRRCRTYHVAGPSSVYHRVRPTAATRASARPVLATR